MKSFDDVANIMFPESYINIKETMQHLENLKNKRGNTIITRFAPSPTGYLHIGGLFSALISERYAHLNNGIFLLRIEDTDKKREVDNGASGIINSLNKFRIHYDEGPTISKKDVGDYGPYTQSERKYIYDIYTSYLVSRGMAYPCFCTSEELYAVKAKQDDNNVPSGYYGEYAKCSNLTAEEAFNRILSGEKYIVRYRVMSNNKNITFTDLIKGKIVLPEIQNHIVIQKCDGLPTYHFAHVIDDHLMGTTHAIRGEEWVNSTNIHLDLFNTFGWTPPSYGHFPVITKIEEGKKRKLSKRKDPEAAVTWYNEEGYPEEAVLEYLLNLANSSFEDWKKSNSDKTLWEFNFKLDKVGSNSPLFDIVKLNNISKNYIGSMDVNTLLHRILDYSKVYDKDTLELLSNNSTVYNKSVLAIRHLGAQVRKDITKYSDYKVVYNYFYNEPVVDIEELSKNILSSEFLYKYFEYFDKVNPHSKEEWFNMMKDIASSMGCATDIKEYKANPDKYRGSVADLSVILRLVITGNKISPDLWDINTVLTRDVFIGRIKKYINLLKKQYTLSA